MIFTCFTLLGQVWEKITEISVLAVDKSGLPKIWKDILPLIIYPSTKKINGYNSAVGSLLSFDKNGPSRQFTGQITYAQHINFSRDLEYEENKMVLGLSYVLDQHRYGDFSNSSPNDPILSENKRYINHNINAIVSYFIENLFASFTANKLLLLYEKKDEQGIEEINMKNYVLSTGYKLYNSPEKSFTFMPMS